MSDSLEVPVKVESVPKLSSDLKYVGVLLVGDIPYRVSGRVKKNRFVGYGMEDTSRYGFGAAMYIDKVIF